MPKNGIPKNKQDNLKKLAPLFEALRAQGVEIEIVNVPPSLFVVDRAVLEMLLIATMTVNDQQGTPRNKERAATMLVNEFVERGWVNAVEVEQGRWIPVESIGEEMMRDIVSQLREFRS